MVSSVEDIPAIERIAPSESPPSSIVSPVLTPKKASPARAVGPLAHEGYTVAPRQVQLAGKELAANILSRITSTRGKEYLHEKAGGVCTFMLQLLELWGASASRGAPRIVCTSALEELQKQGVRTPTSDGWAEYSRAIREACVARGRPRTADGGAVQASRRAPVSGPQPS